VVRRRRKSRSRSRRRSRYSSWDRRNQLSEDEVSAIANEKERNLFEAYQLNPTLKKNYMDAKKLPVCSMLENEWGFIHGEKCALQNKGDKTKETVSKRYTQRLRGTLKGINQYHRGLRCKEVTKRELKHECPK